MSQTSEDRQSLWLVTFSPVIWASHFLLCYATAAIWCAKTGAPGASLAPVRVAIAAYTAFALGGIFIVGRIGYRRRHYEQGEPPHNADTPEDRHRFLGHATLLLSVLSAVGVLYAALVAVFFGTCN
jgi:hypothetical protein